MKKIICTLAFIALFINVWGQYTNVRTISYAPPAVDAGDEYGISIAGNLTSLVGAPGDDSEGVDAGAVYLNLWDDYGETMTNLAKICPDSLDANDRFGHSVAMSYTGGVGTLFFIGAPGDDTMGIDAGAVYVYFYNLNDVLSYHSKLMPNTLAAGDRYGTKVDAGADFMAISAPYDNGGAVDGGAVYMYTHHPASINLRDIIRPLLPQANEHFGLTMKLFAHNGLNYVNYLMVGAPHNSQQAANAGCLYYWNSDPMDNSWDFQVKLYSPQPQIDGFFGSSAMINDNLYIGAPGEDEAGTAQGAVHIYSLRSDTYIDKMLSPTPRNHEYFGSQITTGYYRTLISAIGDANTHGAVYTYVNWNVEETETCLSRLTAETPQAGDMFGNSIYISSYVATAGCPGQDNYYQFRDFEPAVNVVANPLAGGAPLTVAVSNEVPDPPGLLAPLTYEWTVAGVVVSTEASPDLLLTEPGPTSIICTISTGNFSDTDTQWISVGDSLDCDFTADVTEENAPLAVTFNDQNNADIVSWDWDFENDGIIDSHMESPWHNYQTPGYYTVSLTVEDTQGRMGTFIKENYIYARLACDFSTNDTESSMPAVFNMQASANTAVDSWEWNWGDGTSSNIQNASHTYITSGKYTVSLSVTAGNLSATTAKERYLSAYTLDNQLVTWHPFWGDTADEGSLQITNDSQNITQVAERGGRPRGAYEWSVEDAYVTSISPLGENYLSVGMWINAAAAALLQDTSVLWSSQNASGRGLVYTNNNLRIYDGNNEIETGINIVEGTWHHYLLSYGSNNIMLYVDGVLAFTYVGRSALANETVITLGKHPANNLSTFKGIIDDVRVYFDDVWAAQANDIFLHDDGDAVKAIFSANPTRALANEVVSFTDLSYGNINTWQWNFDNDSIVDASLAAPSHTYTAAGTYTVSLEVSDGVHTSTGTYADYMQVANLQEDLVAHYLLDANWQDIGPHNYQAITTGTAYELDRNRVVNAAARWPDADAQVELDSQILDARTSFTLSAWVWLDDTANGDIFIAGDNEFKLYASGGYLYYYMKDRYYNTQIPLLPSTWSHIAISRDEVLRQEKIYINGNYFHSIEHAFDIEPLDVPPMSSFLGGKAMSIDDLRFYARVLTDFEIEMIFTANLPVTPKAEFYCNTQIVPDNYALEFFAMPTFEAVSYAWDFDNDGTVDTNLANPSWSYASAGTYSVSLTIEDAEANTYNILKENYIRVYTSADGLVASYDFLMNYEDSSGNNNHCTPHNAVLGTDRFGNNESALRLRELGDLVEIPHTVLDNQGDFTFVYWLYPNDDFNYYTTVLSGFGVNNRELQNSYSGESNMIYINGEYKFYSNDITLESWNHIALVRNQARGEVHVYINGLRQTNNELGTDVLNIAEGGLWLGNRQSTLGAGWRNSYQVKGKLDDIRFYNRMLTAPEIARLELAPDPAPQIVNFSADQLVLHRTDSVNFTDLSTPTPDSWSWSFGDGNSSDEQHPQHVYDTHGIFDVSLTVTTDGVETTRTFSEYISVFNFFYQQYAYYPLNGDVKDYSAFNNHGTVDNAISTMDRFETAQQAYCFNDVAQSITIPGVSLNNHLRYSVAFWFKTDRPWDIIMNSDNNQYKFYMYGGRITFRAGDSGDWYYSPGLDYNDDVWHHVALTVDTTLGHTSMYIDGEHVRSLGDGYNFDGVIDMTDQNITLGTCVGTALDDLRIYGRELASAEVKLMYNIGNVQPPSVDFHAQNVNPSLNQSIQFINDCTNAPQTFKWSFNNSDTYQSTYPNPEYSYASPGLFGVRLEAGNKWGIGKTSKLAYINVAAHYPPAATMLTPVDVSADVSVFTRLDWAYEGNEIITGYNIYFGPDNPPLFVASSLANETSYAPDNELDANTQYYWQIIPYNDSGESQDSPIWTFTTEQVSVASETVDGAATAFNPAPVNGQAIEVILTPDNPAAEAEVQISVGSTIPGVILNPDNAAPVWINIETDNYDIFPCTISITMSGVVFEGDTPDIMCMFAQLWKDNYISNIQLISNDPYAVSFHFDPNSPARMMMGYTFSFTANNNSALALPAVENLQLSIDASVLTLTWEHVINADYYRLEHSDSPTSAFETLADNITNKEYSLTIDTDNKYYRIIAIKE